MTDTSEDTNYLVDVRAQVMVRDDSTGGWVPTSGGGLSNVSIRKYAIPGESEQVKNEYIIIGKRISDDSAVLTCLVKKDFEYNKVMPTFHHWKTGDKRFGLAFQTAADARAFDKGLRTAVRELLEGLGEKPKPRPRKKRASELDFDDETLELPVTGVDSASDSSLRGSPQTTPQEQVAQMSHFFSTGSEPESPAQSDKYSFSQLSAGQEYTYPDAEGTRLVDEDSSPRKKGTETAPPNAARSTKNDKKKSVRRLCRYCHETYVEECNRRGACEYAPDCIRTTVDEVTCVRAARCMTYHCMSDEEGEFAQHPCECTNEDGTLLRWMGLTILSIFVPCLCLYPPLHSLHWFCSRCGWCGGRHRPAS